MLPETSKRFIDAQVANEIENTALAMLRDAENQKLRAVMVWLGKVFGFMRASPQEVAIEILEIFEKMNDPEIFREIGPLYIFYAEFRNDVLQGASSEEFEQRRFEEILMDLLRSTTDEIRAYFAWHFRNLVDVEGITHEMAVQIATKYMQILTEKYEHLTFNHIYGFIKDQIRTNFEICFDLWKKCIKQENEFLKQNIGTANPREIYRWPFNWNGEILLEIAKQKDDDEFLAWLIFLSDFPKEVRIMGDLDSVTRHLKFLPKEQPKVKEAFKKLLEHDPRVFDAMQEWMAPALDVSTTVGKGAVNTTKTIPSIRLENPNSLSRPKGNYLHFELVNEGTGDASDVHISADGFDTPCFQNPQGILKAGAPRLKIDVRYDRQVIWTELLPNPKIRIHYKDSQNKKYICQVDLIQQKRADGFYNVGIAPTTLKTREVPQNE